METGNQFPMYRVVPGAGYKALTRVPGITAAQLTQLTTIMREILFEAMQDAVNETKARSSLRSRSGSIWRQIMSGLRPRGSGLPSTVSVSFMFRPWIAIHETGGTITPGASKYLTLPMPAALRADGTVKRRNAAGWRDYGTFVYTAKSGKKFLVYKNKDSGKLVFLYYLAERVEMRKRMNLLQSIRMREEVVVNAWNAVIIEMWRGVDLYAIAFEGLRID